MGQAESTLPMKELKRKKKLLQPPRRRFVRKFTLTERLVSNDISSLTNASVNKNLVGNIAVQCPITSSWVCPEMAPVCPEKSSEQIHAS